MNQIVKLRKAGLTMQAIAAKVGVTRQRVHQVLKAEGCNLIVPIMLDFNRRLSEATYRYSLGHSIKRAARLEGVSEHALSAHLHRQGMFRKPVKPAHGTRNRYCRGCRCKPCRAANAAHARRYAEQRSA